MKTLTIIIVSLFILPLSGQTEYAGPFDFISPFHDNVAAVRKGSQWTFINKDGKLIMDFRNNLVMSKIDGKNYPLFNNGRSLIKEEIKGINYYGYIDFTGDVIIAPKYLNAKNFNEGEAIVLELVKEKIGTNEILDKNVVYYTYYEAIIDINGNVKHYLSTGKNIVIDKDFLRVPKIKSKIIAPGLVAIQNNDNKWIVKRLEL